jgi:large subunit ribosomal protein L3
VRDAIKRALPADAPKPGAFRSANAAASAEQPAETPADAAPAAETTNEGGEA